MTMIHHEVGESYSEGSAKALARFTDKMHESIARGCRVAEQAFAENMARTFQDVSLPNHRIVWGVDESGLTMRSDRGSKSLQVTDHAFVQALGRAGISVPAPFARKLLRGTDSQRALLPSILRTLNECEAAEDADRSLVRILNGRVHAVLSNKYKIIDTRPQLLTFAEVTKRFGLVPFFGCNTEVRSYFRVILPRVFLIGENEPILIGLQYSNSDVGGGANTVTMFVIRLLCTNMAELEKVLRQIHLGKAVDAIEDEDGVISHQTRQLAEQTNVSLLNDIVGGFLERDRIGQFVEYVRNANAQQVNVDKAIGDFYKQGKISRLEAEKLRETQKSTDINILPQMGENTAWRLSNLFSYQAQQTASTVRARELEGLAGKVLAELVPKNDVRYLNALPAQCDAAE